jgi:hypothetical protein
MEVFLDIRTLSFMTGITALAMFLCMLHVFARRKTYPGFKHWTFAALAFWLGFSMLSLRHLLPDVGTVVVANLFIGLGAVLICRGLTCFCGGRPKNWQAAASLVLLALLFVYFTHIQPSVNARIVVLSFFLAVFFLRAAFRTKGSVARLLGETDYLLTSALLLAGVWVGLRGVVTWIWGDAIADFMNAGVWHGLSFLVFMVCDILIMAGLVGINSKRTELGLISAKKEIESLQSFLPICANCKKVRDDQGYWQQVESYISEHTGAELTHGICPDCMKKLYPELAKKKPEPAAAKRTSSGQKPV